MVIKIKDKEPISFRSQLEEAAWNTWLPTINHKEAYYEPITFRLTGGKYTPDFVIVMPNNTLQFVEVKGSWKQRGAARSRRNLKEAAGTFSNWGSFIALLPLKRKMVDGKMVVPEWRIEKFN